MNPDLDDRFLEPSGWMWGEVENRDRVVRFGGMSPENPDAIVVCLPGLSEFCEKYFEVARDCLKQNLAFATLDWRGQGLSSRHLKNPLKRHSFGFDQDIEDLHLFIQQIDNAKNLPLIMLGHSMGGNIGFRYLAEHPDVFTRAAFTAPMLGIHAIRFLSDGHALKLSAFLNTILGTRYTSFHGTMSRRQNQKFTRNKLTSDPERFALMETWMEHDPALRVHDVTFGWVYHAIRSCIAARQSTPNIQTPCMFALGGKERITDNRAARAVYAGLPQASLLELRDAHHEIMMERDDIRDQFFGAFFQFAST